MTGTLRPAGHGHALFWFRTAVFGFILASCIREWVPFTILERAKAQIPDAGLQRKQTLEAVEQTNVLLAEIKHLLETGPLNVRLIGADNQAGAPAQQR